MKYLVAITFSLFLLAVLVWRTLTPPLIQPPDQAELVLSGVTVFNPSEAVLTDQTVVVRDGIITEVRARQVADPAPLCPQCWVMPGLIDTHIHTPPAIAFGLREYFSMLHLAYGVTSVRDTGHSDTTVFRWSERIRAGEVVGPHMVNCGPVIDGIPSSWDSALRVTDSAAARRAVRDLHAMGAECIKVYNTLGRVEFEVIEEEARALGLPLLGHVPHGVGLGDVRDFDVQHFTGLPYVHGQRPPLTSDWLNSDLLRLQDLQIEELVELAREQELSFTPTMINSVSRLTASDAERYPATPEGGRVPRFLAAFWAVGMGHPEGEAEIAEAENAFAVQQHIMRRMQQAGVPVSAGTDVLMPWVLPGEALIAEIRLLAEVFENNEAALAAATTLAADVLQADDIGRVAVGARADLLVLGGDPREDLDLLQDWQMVVIDGRVVTPQHVAGWRTRFARFFDNPAYIILTDFLMGFLAPGYQHRAQEDGI